MNLVIKSLKDQGPYCLLVSCKDSQYRSITTMLSFNTHADSGELTGAEQKDNGASKTHIHPSI
jgi:hypothetical protein